MYSTVLSSAPLNKSSSADEFLDDILGLDATFDSVEWQPFPHSPQQTAYECTADVIGYGGAAGGGKSDLLLGKAFNKHQRSIIFRRHFTDLSGIVERGDEILDGACSFVWGNKRRWELPNGRTVELGAVEHDKNKIKYRGRAHDFIGIDEAADFPEGIVRFLTGWLRTTTPGQKTQLVMTFNPPTSADGEWIIRYFAPWLDEHHPNPAMPGELRWFARIDDKDVEVETGAPFDVDGTAYTPESRTFIPAKVEDNPFLMATDYVTKLNNLPEPLRSQLRYGDFNVGVDDDPWQVIPTAWVLAAQARWEVQERPDVAMRTVGVDVARGGKDSTVIAPLYGTYFDDLLSYPGVTTPDGAVVARYVTDAVPGKTPIYIDVIGYGASAYDHLKVLPNVDVTPVNNAGAAAGTDKTGRYKFANIRAFSYWKLREALDPASGEDICLPPTRNVRIDLCTPRFEIRAGKIVVEPKIDIIARTGHSPDDGDALVLAWYGVVAPRAEFGIDRGNQVLADLFGN